MASFRRSVIACLLLVAGASVPATGNESTPTPVVRSQSGVAAYVLPKETRDRAVAYSRARYRLHFAAAAWQVLILAGLLALSIAPRFRNLAERVSKRRFVQALVYTPLVLGLLGISMLPFEAWGHRLAVVYGQSVQGWASWLRDWLLEGALDLAIAVPLVWMMYAILRRSPRRWWLWFWLATLPVIVFLVFLAPFVIDPLFFRFQPLETRAPALVSHVERVTARGGMEIPRDRMYLMEASEKRNSVNAYVTGIGASKRVVIWDTTLEKMTTPETLFVFGHEMGHYVLGHVPKTIAFISAVLLALAFLAHVAARRVLREGRSPFGVRGLSDWASLPLLLLFLAIGSELALPIVNAYSRSNEHDADVYGLEVVHGVVPDAARAGAEAFQVLGEINLSDPDPPRWIRFWLYSHPPIAERIAFARSYDPWRRGEPTRFVPAAASGRP